MYFDSHTHIKIEEITQLSGLLKEGRLGILANASSIEEFKTFTNLLNQNNNTYISFGIHPWDSMNLGKEQDINITKMNIKSHIWNMKHYYQNAHVIGEIGMDSIWCYVDRNIQRLIFIEQLKVAQLLSKPVILHTKGCEEEIAQILEEYTMKKLIHWYSCENHIDKYISQDCYFTIGPDIAISKTAKKIAKTVPMNRILVETDGSEAVKWAIGKGITPYDIVNILEKSIQEISKIKGLSPEFVKKQINTNFTDFSQIK